MAHVAAGRKVERQFVKLFDDCDLSHTVYTKKHDNGQKWVKLKEIEFVVTHPATYEMADIQDAADTLYKLWTREKLNGAKTNLKIVDYSVKFNPHA